MRTALLAAVALVACAKPEVVPAAPVARVDAHHGRSPVTIRWTQLKLGQGAADLELEIEKLIPLEQDLKVSLLAPPGVTLEPASSSWIVFAKDVGVTKRAIRARWVELPREDLFAVADSQGNSNGVRVTAPYRFGRVEAVTSSPAIGAPVEIGNHRIGTPVDLSKP